MGIILLEKEPIDRFSKNLARVALLITVYNELEKNSSNRINRKQLILLQSYIVYLMSTWQEYIKDLTRHCFNKLFSLHPESVYNTLIEANFVSGLENFSSPNTKNVNKLVRISSGLNEVAATWKWNDVKPDFATKLLDHLWDIRCDIAHASTTSSKLSKDICLDYMRFIFNLGCLTNNALSEHINSKTNETSLRTRPLEYPELSVQQLLYDPKKQGKRGG
jgi:hypothetical protein